MTPPLTLAERMAEALKGVPSINATIDRAHAYQRAGLSFQSVDRPLSEYEAADSEAISIELARRLGGANDPA
jgi:hypothetical protein